METTRKAVTQKMQLLLLLTAMVLGLSTPVGAQLTIGGKSDRHYIGPRSAPQRGFLHEGPGVRAHTPFGAGHFKDHSFLRHGGIAKHHEHRGASDDRHTHLPLDSEELTP